MLNDGTDDFSAPGSQTYEAAGDPGFLLDMRWYAENPFADAAGKVDDVCIAGRSSPATRRGDRRTRPRMR